MRCASAHNLSICEKGYAALEQRLKAGESWDKVAKDIIGHGFDNEGEVLARLRSVTPGIGFLPTLQGNIPQADKWIADGGRVRYKADGSMTYMKNGVSVRYNSIGYPDFSKYLYKGSEGLNEVEITLATQGSKATRHRLDKAAANTAAGFKNGTPEDYTWHHNEHKGLMQLVREDVHFDFWHSGGMSLNQ